MASKAWAAETDPSDPSETDPDTSWDGSDGSHGMGWDQVIYDPIDCQFYTWQLAIAQNLGGRRTQEDRLAACPCLGDWNKAFFGLWDGAVDDFAAEEVRKLFLSNLIASSGWAKVSNSNPDPEALQDCLREAIQTTDQEVIRLCRDTQNHYSSCTGVMTLWTGTILTVAHVGDSRATLGYVEDGLVGYEQLTSDHKPDLPDERRRIEEAGGIVALRNQAAFLRGGDFEERKARGETPKGLQYSRAFGGKDLKPYGLSSVPDVKQVTLEAKHKVLIVASDGLWDVCPSERAVHVALDAADRHLDPAQALVQHALAENRCLQRKADNVTVLVVLFSEGLH